jgi:fibronectin type 3 domain-containing protein
VLDVPDPTNPDSAGGGGYDNLLTAASVTGANVAGLTITLTAAPAAPVGAGFTAATGAAGASGKVFDITMTKSPVGYSTQPTITVSAPTANAILSAATTVPTLVSTAAAAMTDLAYNPSVAQGSLLVKTKAIQELFDPTYGRLNATFGVELPYTSALTQTTIPLGYVDQATEEFQDGETQIWKITHNGVDTHPIHFHLLNVQLVNRVGWDNFITPPEQNELGWKEVIKMSPLEDVIVAVRAKKPNLRQSSGLDATTGQPIFATGAGFGLPNSVRRQDPSLPEGAMDGFTQIDPNTGLPATMVNQVVDYGWEYVWHCHILGHEENDFMRPVIFRANEAVPQLATGLTAVQNGTAVDLTWIDNASTEFKYQVQRAAVGSNAWTTVGDLVANATKFSDATAGANAYYDYRVVAIGQAGSAIATVSVMPAPTAIANLAATALSATSVRLNWTDAQYETSYTVERSADNGTTWTPVGAALAANATTVTDNTASAGTTYLYRVTAVNATGSTVSNTATVTTPAAVVLPGVPTGLTGTAVRIGVTTNDTVTLNWSPAATGGAPVSYTVQRCTVTLLQNCNGAAGWSTQGTVNAPTTTFAQTVARGALVRTTYRYRVSATNAAGTSANSTVFSVTAQ